MLFMHYIVILQPQFILRWLNTVFLDNHYLLINKKYLTYIKQHLKSFNFLHKSYATAVAMATMTFQDGGYFGFKVI